jgi:hypothetical protein
VALIFVVEARQTGSHTRTKGSLLSMTARA